MIQFADRSLSLLELAAVPQGSSVKATLENLRAYAQTADQLGFERLWLAEHHNMEGIASSATSVLLADLANHTQTIRLGSGGIMLPNHAPLIVAEQFGTLEALHPNRIDLGLGRAPGTDPLTSRALRRDEQAADHFADEVLELQRLLGPRGDHAVQAYPGCNSNVPIWLLGSSLYSAQLAAQLGLPYAFAGHFAPALAKQALELYRARFQVSDVLDHPHAILCVPLIIADSDDEAQFLATSGQLRVKALLQGQPLYLPPPVDNIKTHLSGTIRAHVNEFLSLAVVGSVASVASKLHRLLAHFPVDELMFTNDIFDRNKRLQALHLLAQLCD